MNKAYKNLQTLDYRTIVESYFHGTAYQAEEQVLRSAIPSPEITESWAASVREQTPEIAWEQPYHMSVGKYFGSSGHPVSYKLSMRGKHI